MFSFIVDKENIGLYIDDGLVLLENCTVVQADRLSKKRFRKTFEKFDLKVAVVANQN